ncbi:hypothetical protein VDGD_09333 [Verticillium dahliae]|nr:hypothetical protein VdG1_02773 [Verticillium dahliae VDG1]RBQ85258.1 hypothetical protein VDGD_09333 [Verticillium dahliae]
MASDEQPQDTESDSFAEETANQGEVHAEILQQCQSIVGRISTLIDELQQLKEVVDQRPVVGSKPLPWNQAITGLGVFERLVLSEKRNVDNMLKLCQTAQDDDTDLEVLNNKLRTKLDACNYKFHDLVWSTAKKCHNLVGLRRDFSRTPANRKTDTVIVDAVVSGGAEWIKVVNTTERRLFYEMTDAGWDWDDDEDTDPDEPPLPDGSENDIEVARFARQLVAAASITYHDYRRPTVRMLLTRIREGENHHVDRLLNYIRTFGGEIDLTLETASDTSGLLSQPTPSIEDALSHLVITEPFKDFTTTLNVDCSVFMALASDFSHMAIGPDSDLLRSAQHLIDARDEVENGPRLLTTMYPAITGRDLVCTQDAADTFLKIAYDIGTESEVARARILFEASQDAPVDADAREADCKRRLDELRKLSCYAVPDDLRLPIRTVGTITWDKAQKLVEAHELPEVALVVGQKGSGLNAMNVSSFLYGWKAHLTTITSNWEAAKRLKTVIEANRVAGDDVVGPQIWRIPFARKLLAKPKSSGLPPLKTRKDRKREKVSSLQRWAAEDGQTEKATPETVAS